MATTTSKYAYPDLPTTADRGMYDYYYDIDRVIRKIGTSTEDIDNALTAAKTRLGAFEQKNTAMSDDINSLQDRVAAVESKLDNVMKVLEYLLSNYGMRLLNLERICSSMPVVHQPGNFVQIIPNTNAWSSFSAWLDPNTPTGNYSGKDWGWDNNITPGSLVFPDNIDWDKLLEQARGW